MNSDTFFAGGGVVDDVDEVARKAMIDER